MGKDRDAGISDSYKEEFGFEEWFADNLGGWLLREAQKPVNGVESFFKRLADKIRSVFNSLNENFRARFRRNESLIPTYKMLLNPIKMEFQTIMVRLPPVKL